MKNSAVVFHLSWNTSGLVSRFPKSPERAQSCNEVSRNVRVLAVKTARVAVLKFLSSGSVVLMVSR